MSNRACLVIGLTWVLSLAAVATAVRFESTTPRQSDGGVDRRLPSPVANVASSAVSSANQARYVPFRAPKVMSGEDVGFQVEGMYGEQPVGSIVLRVKGKWVEAGFAPQTRPW
jgi:hypothetical protein